MFRRLLIASVCTSALAVVAPASASLSGAPAASSSGSLSDRTQVTVKKVVRQYGDGPVGLRKGEQLVLRFEGRRGDRVRLGSWYREGDKSYYGDVGDEVALSGARTTSQLGADGFFRLRETGWFTLTYHKPSNDWTGRGVQLFKQTTVNHSAGQVTRLPQRRGVEYGVRLRVPKAGIEVTTFANYIYGVVSRGEQVHPNAAQSLVLIPGEGAHVDGSGWAMTEQLEPREPVLVRISPSSRASVRTTKPIEAGRVRLDGPAAALPGGGTRAVVAELVAADLAASAQRLLNVRLSAQAGYDWWAALVLPEGGGVAGLSASSSIYGSPSLYQLADTAGTFRVLVFPTSKKADAAEFELDSVADAGTVAVDGEAVTVPARPDGRYSLLTITQPATFTLSYLTVADVTVPGRWEVYAGSLTGSDCSEDTSLGCGDFDGASLSESGTRNTPQRGGFVLTMPLEGQTSGSLSVRLSRTYP